MLQNCVQEGTEKAPAASVGAGSSSNSRESFSWKMSVKLLVKLLVKLVELLRVQPTVGNCPSDPVCLFYFRSKLCLASRQGSRGPFPTLRLSNKIQS